MAKKSEQQFDPMQATLREKDGPTVEEQALIQKRVQTVLGPGAMVDMDAVRRAQEAAADMDRYVAGVDEVTSRMRPTIDLLKRAVTLVGIIDGHGGDGASALNERGKALLQIGRAVEQTNLPDPVKKQLFVRAAQVDNRPSTNLEQRGRILMDSEAELKANGVTLSDGEIRLVGVVRVAREVNLPGDVVDRAAAAALVGKRVVGSIQARENLEDTQPSVKVSFRSR